jgi:hypothetical protein
VKAELARLLLAPAVRGQVYPGKFVRPCFPSTPTLDTLTTQRIENAIMAQKTILTLTGILLASVPLFVQGSELPACEGEQLEAQEV